MKKYLWILAFAAACLAAVACTPKAKTPKVLVLYYSQTANTKAVAEEIATQLGADIEEILPLNPYSGSFMETVQRAGDERESGNMPEIQPLQSKIADYDLIFIGYPVWSGTYAWPIATLLDEVDFSGKKIVPFCTFGSGGLGSSSQDIAAKLTGSEVLPGYGVRAARLASVPKEVERFLKSNGYLAGEVEALEEFSDPHEVSEEEAAIFDAAVSTYPMIRAKANTVASRTIPDGTEYLFTAVDLPREGAPQMAAPQEMKVYVTVENGKAPEFTEVVR